MAVSRMGRTVTLQNQILADAFELWFTSCVVSVCAARYIDAAVEN